MAQATHTNTDHNCLQNSNTPEQKIPHLNSSL